MTCPSCGGELVQGADRCPVCDTPAAPRVEGALAADPRLVTTFLPVGDGVAVSVKL
jgi:hypothetical protein